MSKSAIKSQFKLVETILTFFCGLSKLSPDDEGRPPTNSAKLSSSDVKTTSVEYFMELFSVKGDPER